MKRFLSVVFCAAVLVGIVGLSGCGQRADEAKPMDEIKAEVEKMDVAKLKSMAMTYKEAIVAKKGDVDKLMAKIKEIPVTEALGDEAKALKGELEAVTSSVKALKDRFDVYYNKLVEKGGDVAGLEIQ